MILDFLPLSISFRPVQQFAVPPTKPSFFFKRISGKNHHGTVLSAPAPLAQTASGLPWRRHPRRLCCAPHYPLLPQGAGTTASGSCEQRTKPRVFDFSSPWNEQLAPEKWWLEDESGAILVSGRLCWVPCYFSQKIRKLAETISPERLYWET